MTGGHQGAIQFAHQFLNRAVLFAGDGPQRPPVMLVGFQSDGLI